MNMNKKSGPHSSREWRAAGALVTRSRGVRFPVPLPVAAALTEAFAVWPWELRLPSPDGSRAVWFASASAASPAESRINLLHGTPRRHYGVGEARDWPRHSKPR